MLGLLGFTISPSGAVAFTCLSITLSWGVIYDTLQNAKTRRGERLSDTSVSKCQKPTLPLPPTHRELLESSKRRERREKQSPELDPTCHGVSSFLQVLGNACGQRQITVTRGGRATPKAPPISTNYVKCFEKLQPQHIKTSALKRMRNIAYS